MNDEGRVRRVEQWVEELATLALEDGLYLSFDTDTRPERIHDAFGANLPRLRRIKRAYDPDNVFRADFPHPTGRRLTSPVHVRITGGTGWSRRGRARGR